MGIGELAATHSLLETQLGGAVVDEQTRFESHKNFEKSNFRKSKLQI
jgi:hypothetical protein